MSSGFIGRVVFATLVVAWFGSASLVAAQSAEELVASKHVMIRSRLEPSTSILVGQPVRLWVEAMTRTWFRRAPVYPATIEIRGAIVIPPESFGVNSSERIGGETYAVQARSFMIFPQTVGRFEVPPVEITLVVARDDGSASPPISLRTQPAAIEATLPPGIEGRGLVLSTPAFTAEEEYDRSLDGLRVGDSFHRRVTMTIEDSVAMLLPPMRFDAGDGIAVYPDRARVEDTRDRGKLSGTRVDAATYVLEAEGTYTLPEIAMAWWNLRTSRLERVRLPAVTLSVAANPDLAAQHLGGPEQQAGEEAAEALPAPSRPRWQQILGAAIVLAFLVIGANRVKRWLDRRSAERAARGESEPELFHKFVNAAERNDARAAYLALVRWLDHVDSNATPATVHGLVTRVNDTELTRDVANLDQVLFSAKGSGRDTAWSGHSLARSLSRARRRLDDLAARPTTHAPLPPLNP